MRRYLAVDIGASSGRHIVGWVEGGRIHTREVYRFDNHTIEKDGLRCWDTGALFKHIVEGMRQCRVQDLVPSTMGVDTWAVDYLLLDNRGKPLAEAVCYRDPRTGGMDAQVEQRLPFAQLYSRTGIQKQPFNTIYQLMAEQQQRPQLLASARRLLMMPEYFHYLLTGHMVSEYTNATSTALVNAESKTWDAKLLDRLGLPRHLFGPLNPPGNWVGTLTPELQQQLGYNCTVVLPATHDTASAFLAVPAAGEQTVFLSSGTWSLLGVENTAPLLTEAARRANFTNEGGYGYRYRFLKNIMGLWMIQSLRRELPGKPSYAELEQAARAEQDFAATVDVNDPRFLAPASMADAVRDACRESGQPLPQNTGQLVQFIYRSLAACYATAIKELEGITGKKYTGLNIVGGGSKDSYLNQLTASATGLPVYAGPTEGTVVGNLLAQMLAADEFASVAEARAAVARSFEISSYLPQ